LRRRISENLYEERHEYFPSDDPCIDGIHKEEQRRDEVELHSEFLEPHLLPINEF